jgi:ketosteroid isomerase-like protein
MSENLDLVRSIYADWERGDYGSVGWQHPEIEYVMADGPTPGRWIGATGAAQGWGTFLSAWEGFHHRADEYRELDSERVLVLSRFGGRGKTSGLDIEQMGTNAAVLFDIAGDKVTRIVLYFDRDRALADLGLKE